MTPSRLLLFVALVATASCKRELDKVVVNPPSLKITEPAGTGGFKAEALDTRGQPMADQAFTFTSSDPEVATIDRLGWVTAMRGGTATITATTGGKSGTASVDVSYPARLILEAGQAQFKARQRTGEATAITDRLTLPALGAQVALKGTLADELERPLQPATLVVASNDPSIIGVEKDGVTLTARGYGQTLVTASHELYSVAMLVSVAPPASLVIQAPKSVSLREGQTQSLAVRLQGVPQSAASSMLTFATSDPNVVSAQPSGELIGVRAGKAKVTVAAGDKSAVVDVVVTGGARPR